jgi:hypothetical protein
MSSGFFCWKAETIVHSFHEQMAQILMLAMTFWSANNIKNLPTISRTSSQQCQKPATKSMVAYQSIVLNLSL